MVNGEEGARRSNKKEKNGNEKQKRKTKGIDDAGEEAAG